MQSLTLESPVCTVDRGRLTAWQFASATPLVVLIISTVLKYEPSGFWLTSCGILLIMLVSVAAVTDLLWYKIPNWLTYPAFGWGIVANGLSQLCPAHLTANWGCVGIVDSLAGALVPFFFMLVIFSMTGGGAGDVKLTAALGAFLGLSRVVDAVLLSFIIAGGFALVRAVWILGTWNLVELVFRGIASFLLPIWIDPPNKEHSKLLRKPMPLGPSFAIGVAAVLFNVQVQRFLELI